MLFNVACSLLQGPQRPILPTPIPSPPPLSLEVSGDVIIDPVSEIAPTVSADIAALMNEVSQQQLIAYVQTLERFGTRNTFSATEGDFGIGAARSWLLSEFSRVGGGRLQVRFDEFPMTYNGLTTNQQNIVATLPGSSSHQGVIILSAHYDSRSLDPASGTSLAPGANDNASGVAILLELARVLSSRTWNQTVMFVAFAAEEQGRFGSRHFVQDMMLDGRVIDAVLNNDIVGGRPGIPQSLRLFSPGPNDDRPRQFARYVDYVSGLYLPTFFVDLQDTVDREGRYSDHIEFLAAGIPAVRLTESVEDFDRQHNGRDTSDLIDFSYLRQVAQLNLVVIANVIGAPPQPVPPQVAPMATAGDFLLTWAPDPLAAGYAIMFRPLGSPTYTSFRLVNARDAGNVALTGFDPNTLYAVSMAALDSNGRISLFSPEILVSAQ